MKLSRKLFASIIGVSAIAGSTFAITSCSTHTNPWSSLQSFNPFSILDDDNASELMSIAKEHIPQSIGADPSTVFSSIDEKYGREVVYWSIAYAVAENVRNVTHQPTYVHGSGSNDSLDVNIDIKTNKYAIKTGFYIGVIQLTGEPKAFDDKQMRIGDTNTIG
jgi:hypothetical protein